MGTFRTLQGTAEEIDKELNILVELNHVKIVGSNSIVIQNDNLNYKIVNTAHVYYTPKSGKHLNKNGIIGEPNDNNTIPNEIN